MTTEPNVRETAKRDSEFPTPTEILSARTHAGLSQEQAAQLVNLGAGMRWSEYERGVRRMDAMRFELFQIKTGQHMEYGPLRGRFARRIVPTTPVAGK